MMSCFFCDSKFHVSHNCDIYVDEESRQNILSLKKSCPNCLALLNNKLICLKCRSSQKCFICFSMDHSTVYCPFRIEKPNMFPPKIDEDLLFRFGQLLNVEEKWTMVSSYPKMFDTLKFERLKIRYAEKCYFSYIQYYSNYDIVIAEKGIIHGSGDCSDPCLNPPIFHIEYLEIKCSSLFTQEFLVLLSPKTKILMCNSTKFRPRLNFRQILEKAPNLENIDISDTNVKIDNSWYDDIPKLNNGTLRYLFVSFPNLNIDIGGLISLLKRTSVKIYFYFVVSKHADGIYAVRKELSKHFIPRNKWDKEARVLFGFRGGKVGRCHYDCYALTEV